MSWVKPMKCATLQSILSLLRNKFDKLNNTRVLMLDVIYHMTPNTSNKFNKFNNTGVGILDIIYHKGTKN